MDENDEGRTIESRVEIDASVEEVWRSRLARLFAARPA